MAASDLTTYSTDALLRELRNRLPVVIVWQDEDLPEGTDLDFFDWDTVEDRSIEAGNDAITFLAGRS